MSFYRLLTKLFLPVLLIFSVKILAQSDSIVAVTPNVSPEAADLLEYIYSIQGKNTLAGQHCQPSYGSLSLTRVHRQTGHYPALFGQDFGFSYPGYLDGINYRQRIVDEAIRRHRDGFINTIMWHAVPPTEDEPVTFGKSIQSNLSDEQWQELITPGTELNERWKSQVDVIAFFLKQLRFANVPVLWRPYHEMNGGWFWWGDKKGEDGYKKLWHMMFDRLVNFHKLNNLIWVYNTNEMKEGVGSHEEYFPGHDVVDIIATDFYSNEFDSLNYAEMSKLANGKPMAIGECGYYPTPEKLKEQPNWAWFMKWGDPPGKNYREAYGSDEVLTLEELPWTNFTTPKMHHPFIK